MDTIEIEKFLMGTDYDIRKSGDGRWIDQKCAFDVLYIISDCVCNYLDEKGWDHEFTTRDIWNFKYSEDVIDMYFAKPGVKDKKATNEYDKFFSQPLKLLGYSRVLNVYKKGNQNIYSINNKTILEYIAQKGINSFNFLRLYIEKVLKDSDLFYVFEDFFQKQDKCSYDILKTTFRDFTIKYTNINKPTEPNRIFIKVINPLSCYYKKLGTVKGYMSEEPISYSDLAYNQKNFRDIYADKPKNVTRNEWYELQDEKPPLAFIEYESNKAVQFIRKFNNKYRKGYTEVYDQDAGPGTHIHHIFPKSDFKQISYFYENLIALSPSQHFIHAHPNGNTRRINVKYQKFILLEKAKRINENLENKEIETIYSYSQFIEVLNEGLKKQYDSTLEYKLKDIQSIITECYEAY